MSTKERNVLAGVCAFAVIGICAAPAWAQTAEIKAKPPMYTYVSSWAIPRARWPEMEKGNATNDKILEKAIASGTLVGYGDDLNLVHQPEGSTHDSWWSSMSMAGLLNILDEFHKAGTSTASVLSSATKHWDGIYLSRYYNWRSGSSHGSYTHGASYKLKSDAPDDAVDTLSAGFIVPLMEKLLADGTLQEYEVDVEAIHTETPGTFWVFYIATNAEGLDKATAALSEALKANPFAGPAVGSMVDFTAHRDYLSRTNATYK